MNRTGILPPPDDDPDRTDRLPALDSEAAAQAKEDESLETTGSWADIEIEAAGLRCELELRDIAIAELTSRLREKTFALTRLEKELEQVRSDLMHARQAVGRDAAVLERRLQELERDHHRVLAQHDERRATIASLEDQLSEAREREQHLEGRIASLLAAVEAGSQRHGPKVVSGVPMAADEGGGAISAQRYLARIDDGAEIVHMLSRPRISVGRIPGNDVQVRESYISRIHAFIKLGPDGTVIEDADSRNGVFVNDRRVRRERLQDGDVVTLGKARFRFQLRRADRS
jgi:hypothetical protein